MADDAYGTSNPDAPVTRAELERALRHLNIADLDLRDGVLQLAARVVALTDELTRRLDGVEPAPAPPDTKAAAPTQTVEQSVGANLDAVLFNVRVGDAGQQSRVMFGYAEDKYTTESPEIPCSELLHLCKAACCALSFALTTQDLDEGVIRWDYGQPYLIRQRASDGYCVHNDPQTRGCSVHAQRPATCRTYDCREDERIWLDFANRVPAPKLEGAYDANLAEATPFDLLERARSRTKALLREKHSMMLSHGDEGPKLGPKPRR